MFINRRSVMCTDSPSFQRKGDVTICDIRYPSWLNKQHPIGKWKVCRRPAADLPQTCRRLLVCGKEYAEVCGRKKFCCRLAAYQYATGTVCGRSAAGWNFAADLPHTSMPQEQSAADLLQDEILLQTCCILVCHRNSLRQICGRMKLCSRLAAY